MRKVIPLIILSALLFQVNHSQCQQKWKEFEAPLVMAAHADHNDTKNENAFIIPEAYQAVHSGLKNSFHEFEVYDFDFRNLAKFLRESSQKIQFRLRLGNTYTWDILLEPHDIRGTHYTSRTIGEFGTTPNPYTRSKTYKGILLDPQGGEVRLTVSDEFIQGFITYQGEKIFIEDLHSLGILSQANHMIAYAQSKVTQDTPLQCAATETHDRTQHLPNHRLSMQQACDGLLEVEVATAATPSRYEEFDNDVQAVNDYILSLYNMIEANYNPLGITFKVVEQVVFTNRNMMDFTESNPSNLLREFTDWGPSGFQNDHDLGALFYNGAGSGTVGVAWISATCSNSYKYSVNDFLGSAEKNRVLLAHETGHNFGARHDQRGSPFIMAPSVNRATEFSNVSRTAINDLLDRVNCLSCVNSNPEPDPNTPPVATNQSFEIEEKSIRNTLVGQINAKDPDGDPLQYTIESGNADNAFSLDAQSGELRVNTPAALTPNRNFNLFVVIADNKKGSITIKVTINVKPLPLTKPIAAIVANPVTGDAPLEVSFDASNSKDAGGTIESYEWTWGNGQQGVGIQTQTTYQEAGTYTATLIITDNDGHKDTAYQVITVKTPPPINKAPNAAFTASVTTGNAPLKVDMDASASKDEDGRIVSYTWNLGNGNEQTGVKTSITYADSGVYTVSLIVVDDKGLADTAVQTIVVKAPIPVNQAPNAVLSATPVEGRAPLQVSVDASASKDGDGIIESYLWDFGNGAQGTSVEGSTVYTDSGSYTITLIVIDDDGASDTVFQTIRVGAPIPQNQAPTASMVVDPVQGMAPLEVSVDASASIDPDGDIKTYLWDWGNGRTAKGRREKFTYTDPGKYTLTLVVVDDKGKSDTTTQMITVQAGDTTNQKPQAVIVATPIQGTAPLQVSLDASSSTDPDGVLVAAIWDMGNGQQGDGLQTNVTYTDSGRYEVMLIVTDNRGASDTAIQVIQVDPLPQVEIKVVSQSFTIQEKSEEGTSVGIVQTTETFGKSIVFSILEGNEQNAFAIDSLTGEITVNSSEALDYNRQVQFNLTIALTYNDPTPISTQGIVTINLEALPKGSIVKTITLRDYVLNYHLAIPENSPNGTLVGSVLGTDLSGRDISFSITGGLGSDVFTIDELTGQIFVSDESFLDYELRRAYLLKVKIIEKREENGRTRKTKLTVFLRIDILDMQEAMLYPEVVPLISAHEAVENDPLHGKEKLLADLHIYPNPASSWLFVELNNTFKGKITIQLYDLSGRIVMRSIANKQSAQFAQELQLNRLQSGMYLVKVQFGGQSEIDWINVTQ